MEYKLFLTQICQDYIEGLVFRYIKKIMFKFVGLFKIQKNSVNQTVLKTDSTSVVQLDHVKKDNELEIIGDSVETNVSKKESETEDKNTTDSENDGEVSTKAKSEDNLETEMRQRKIQLNSANESENAASTSKGNNKNETKDMKKNNMNHDSIHFHFSLFLLWVIISVLNVPSVLTWARNFQFSKRLHPDPSSITGTTLSICAIFLWQMEIPKRNKLYYKEIGMFIYAMAVTCLVYAPLSVYRLTYILTLTIIVVTLHQVFGPEQYEDEKPSESDNLLDVEPDPVDQISNIKNKLE